jgi:hypothetical protein
MVLKMGDVFAHLFEPEPEPEPEPDLKIHLYLSRPSPVFYAITLGTLTEETQDPGTTPRVLMTQLTFTFAM